MSSTKKSEDFSRHHFCLRNARGVCRGTTENQVMSDGSPRGDFYRK